MGVGIAGNPDESFFAFDPGSYNEIWATQSYDINGITPQTIHVQFSNQFVVDANDVPEGSTFSGTSDFSSTLTLAQIQVVDANGNEVTSGSGQLPLHQEHITQQSQSRRPPLSR